VQDKSDHNLLKSKLILCYENKRAKRTKILHGRFVRFFLFHKIPCRTQCLRFLWRSQRAKSGKATPLLKVRWNFACLRYGAQQPPAERKRRSGGSIANVQNEAIANMWRVITLPQELPKEKVKPFLF